MEEFEVAVEVFADAVADGGLDFVSVVVADIGFAGEDFAFAFGEECAALVCHVGGCFARGHILPYVVRRGLDGNILPQTVYTFCSIYSIK